MLLPLKMAKSRLNTEKKLFWNGVTDVLRTTCAATVTRFHFSKTTRSCNSTGPDECPCRSRSSPWQQHTAPLTAAVPWILLTLSS